MTDWSQVVKQHGPMVWRTVRRYQDIAAELGLTVNHVGVLLNRARASLRQRLRVYEPAPAVENIGKEIKP